MSDDELQDPARSSRPLFESIKRSRKSGTSSTDSQASQQHRCTSILPALPQSTSNTIHKESSDEVRPFPFLQLPLELQKLIVEKYYEDTWSVSIDWSPIGPTYTRLSAPHVNPSPVNHHFYEEMNLALVSSRSGRLLLYGMPHCEMELERFFNQPTVCDKAITKVSLVEGSFLSRCLEVWKRRFINLEVIEVGLQTSLLAHTRFSLYPYIMQRDTLDFVDGVYDDDFLRCTHKLVVSQLSCFHSGITILGDTVMDWKLKSRGPRCQCRRRKCPAMKPTLQMVIRTSKGRSLIIERRFLPRSGSAKNEDAIAHLRALRVIAQEEG